MSSEVSRAARKNTSNVWAQIESPDAARAAERRRGFRLLTTEAQPVQYDAKVALVRPENVQAIAKLWQEHGELLRAAWFLDAEESRTLELLLAGAQEPPTQALIDATSRARQIKWR